MNPRRSASPLQILAIRAEARRGALNTRSWAQALGCSIETIRRYARGDTAAGITESSSSNGQAGEVQITTAYSEPTEGEIAASIARLTEAARPAQEATDMLAELTKKGREGR